MIENFIYIQNVKENDILKALQNLANLYADTGYTDEIKLYRKKDLYDSFAVTFTNLPDFDRFSYFVNYLYFPFDLDVYEPKLKGYYMTKNIKDNLEFKTGNWVMLFMTKDFTDYDEVSLVNENNINYNFNFGGRTKKLNETLGEYRFKNFDSKDYHPLKDIKPNGDKKESKPWWKFW